MNTFKQLSKYHRLENLEPCDCDTCSMNKTTVFINIESRVMIKKGSGTGSSLKVSSQTLVFKAVSRD